jgi:DNA-binding transcriptional LysR family regulator
MRFNKLDLNLLLLLDALLAQRNVSKVAVQFNLSQPAISNALARLRRYFKDDLLVSVGNRMMATTFAERLKEPLAAFITASEAICQSPTEFDARVADRTFSIVASDYVALVLLTRLTRRIAAAAPLISIRHVPLDDRSLDRFQKGLFDVLIGPDYLAPAGASSQPLFEERLVPIVWSGNADHGDTISAEAFAEADIVLQIASETPRAGAIRDVIWRMRAPDTRRVMVEGFALVPDFVVGTPYVALLAERFARLRATQMPIRLLDAAFELPAFREQLFWMPHLSTVQPNLWLRAQIEATVAEMATEEARGPVTRRSARPMRRRAVR